MNISKTEQRVLHALAQGGSIYFERADNGKITKVQCFTREGYVLDALTLAVFDRLKRRRLIRSVRSRPYQITRQGLLAVRAQLNNR